MTDDSDQTPHERLPEEWVQNLEDGWERTYGPEELARIRSEGTQPIDEYLHEAWVGLRRLCGQLILRVDSYLPLDEQRISETGRQAVRDAIQHLTHARGLLEAASGEERMAELERRALDEIHRKAWNDVDDDTD